MCILCLSPLLNTISCFLLSFLLQLDTFSHPHGPKAHSLSVSYLEVEHLLLFPGGLQMSTPLVYSSVHLSIAFFLILSYSSRLSLNHCVRYLSIFISSSTATFLPTTLPSPISIRLPSCNPNLLSLLLPLSEPLVIAL